MFTFYTINSKMRTKSRVYNVDPKTKNREKSVMTKHHRLQVENILISNLLKGNICEIFFRVFLFWLIL